MSVSAVLLVQFHRHHDMTNTTSAEVELWRKANASVRSRSHVLADAICGGCFIGPLSLLQTLFLPIDSAMQQATFMSLIVMYIF